MVSDRDRDRIAIPIQHPNAAGCMPYTWVSSKLDAGSPERPSDSRIASVGHSPQESVQRMGPVSKNSPRGVEVYMRVLCWCSMLHEVMH
ncbi:uncharacterized protein PGTG_22050 [Puccinia graminis f. sp. tritici CRL 75-36-700-3]|uniref:Uncharacterized protein n=1 Tax=Puccinia graminis f. sp. tritici (strain CRL 75-36-700-3 / race SCCL) TaxID=418459 RepID=H6QTH8_PUCGT|nr:uncharacterized protein PGTG_22050 [Puccinia graminis f. sp. tritici CRL 75-36-700-3]EHS64193.1 hypothetical protein PGTG_22050 [Puccinia graminis f. sp. tritici CRL 75-36-700-3]